MTERKNVTLPAPYDKMFQDLKSRGEFNRAFGSFSEFVQAMIEEFHDNPDKVRAEYHKKQMEKHQQLKENFEEHMDMDLENGDRELEGREKEFFDKFVEKLEQKKGTREWHKKKRKVYNRLEDGWINRYAGEFGSITESEFREKLLEYVGEQKLKELGLTGEVS